MSKFETEKLKTVTLCDPVSPMCPSLTVLKSGWLLFEDDESATAVALPREVWRTIAVLVTPEKIKEVLGEQ